MTAPSTSAPGARAPFAAGDMGLFAGTVLVWSANWLAVKYQAGIVDPQVSLVWRFLIAAPLMFLLCWLNGTKLALPLRAHLYFAVLGLLFFSTNFILFYYASHYMVSGLVAVIFSLSAIWNILLAAIFLREAIRPRVAIGALVGLCGLALLFGHEIDGHLQSGVLTGLALGCLGGLAFSAGSIVAAKAQREGIPALAVNAWGMGYGVVMNSIAALATGSAFIIEPSARYIGGLLWLAIPGSVIGVWAYMLLLSRLGADRAGYTTVLTPALALLISTYAEDYRWSALAVGGLALVCVGNVLVLTRKRS